MKAFKEKLLTTWITYKTSKTVWFLGLAIVIVMILIITRGSRNDSETITEVTTRDIIEQVVLSGRTQSASAVDLGFADQGRIASVFVSEGDKVKTGQVLASLDISDLNADLKNARASLAIAQADAKNTNINLDKITREQDVLVANAYRNLLSSDLAAVPENTSYDTAPPVISGTYDGPEGDYILRVYPSNASSGASFQISGIEQGTGEVVTTSSSALGTKGLFVRFIDGESYVNTDWIVSIPNIRSTSYAANYNAYISAQATRDRVIADARSQLSQTSTEQSVVTAKIDQAQSRVDAILSQINKRRITAPFAGIVANNDLKAGQSTSSVSSSSTSGNQSIITLISPDDYEVVLKTPEISIAKLSVGQQVAIALDAYGNDQVFPGIITSINPAETIVDGVPIYETKVLFTDPDERIRSGMTAIATIVTGRKDGVVAIPISALESDKKITYVSVVDADDKLQRRDVVTGMRSSDGFVEIVSGLKPGEKIMNINK